MTPPPRPTLAQNIAGGATAASLALPASIALGAVTFDVLGPGYASIGIGAGLWGTILCSVLIVLLGSRSAAVHVPRSVTAVFVAAMLMQAAATWREVTGEAPAPNVLFASVFFFLALAGAFQALIGLFRLGALVKYMPHPVLAGFMNAVSILLVLAQLPALLGLPPGSLAVEALVSTERIGWGAVVVSATTFAVLRASHRLPWRLPHHLVALIAGTAVHHLLGAFAPAEVMGGVLGAVSSTPPSPSIPLMPAFIDAEAFPSLLPGIAAAAFGLALIVSLDALLNMKALERLTLLPSDAQRELARLGLANTATALLGAMPCGISLGASGAARAAGARGAASNIAMAAVAVLAVLIGGSALGLLPRSAVAAILIVIAWGVLDRPTIATIRRLLSGGVRNRSRLAADVLVMLIVASIAMLASVAVAVAAGLVIAVLSFLVNMSHSVVRREIRGDAIRSRRSRSASEMESLSRLGSRIAVIELQGVIFFGTADDLLARIETCLTGGASHIILDLRRVHDVDSTGAQMLIQIHERVAARGRRLVVSEASPGRPQWDFLVDSGVVKSLGDAAFVADTDGALEIAEQEILALEANGTTAAAEIPLASLQPFERLTEDEIADLQPKLSRRNFGPGEFVFREGQPGNELFVIARGSASIRRMDGNRSLRLVTFGAGMVFGELALLDATPRSATVQADGELVCWVMSRALFDEIVEERQAVALKILASLSRELGRRLRFANDTISHMQS